MESSCSHAKLRKPYFLISPSGTLAVRTSDITNMIIGRTSERGKEDTWFIRFYREKLDPIDLDGYTSMEAAKEALSSFVILMNY